MATLCEKCKMRSECTELCETAEQFVSQDNVSKKRCVESYDEGVYHGVSKEELSDLHLTPMQKKVGNLLIQGYTHSEIAQELEITYLAVKMHVHKMRKKWKPNAYK